MHCAMLPLASFIPAMLLTSVAKPNRRGGTIYVAACASRNIIKNDRFVVVSDAMVL
jgi:hypothetical protein